jgi:hypothetical protein
VPLINTKLLDLPFAIKIATRDFHPQDHISFASQHEEAEPFEDTYTFKNPENEKEEETT